MLLGFVYCCAPLLAEHHSAAACLYVLWSAVLALIASQNDTRQPRQLRFCAASLGRFCNLLRLCSEYTVLDSGQSLGR
jgi:hypothetical protein